MNKKELEKEYDKIVHEQIGDEGCRDGGCEDVYPIQLDVLAIALDYIPAKVLKRIIARYKKLWTKLNCIAASLYNAKGFAHMRSIVSAYGLYEKILLSYKLQATSNKQKIKLDNSSGIL